MKDFKKYYILAEEPDIVYKGLTNADVIRLWTGHPAVMEEKPGSEFSLWDGSIVGKNLEFETGKRIVQEWYFEGEAPSVVTIKLHPHKHGTSVELHHSNIPDDAYENMVEGWNGDYFGALADFYTD